MVFINIMYSLYLLMKHLFIYKYFWADDYELYTTM